MSTNATTDGADDIEASYDAAETLKLARKSIQEYSELAGHDLSYRLDWR